MSSIYRICVRSTYFLIKKWRCVEPCHEMFARISCIFRDMIYNSEFTACRRCQVPHRVEHIRFIAYLYTAVIAVDNLVHKLFEAKRIILHGFTVT